MDLFLDNFFILFHTLFILFNLFGWIGKKTRLYNFLTLVLTGLSWFVLGIWKGIGYCPCTDWHWQVRERLGHHDMPNSYLKFLLDKLTGLNFNANLVDYTAFILFFVVLFISSYVNRDKIFFK